MQRCTGTVKILLETMNTELGRLLDETPSGNTSSGIPQEYTHIVERHKGRQKWDSKGEKHYGKGVLDLGFRDNGKANCQPEAGQAFTKASKKV